MRIRALVLAVVVTALMPWSTPPSVAHAEVGPTASRLGVTIWSPNVPPDITLGPTAYFQAPTGDPLEVEVSRSDARSAAMAPWETYLASTEERIFEPAIASGQVLCLRYRYLFSDGPGDWTERCTVRGWRDEHFSVVGAADHAASREFSDGLGTSLRDGGRLVVPDLLPGMRVAAVVGNLKVDPLDGFRGLPYWRGPSDQASRADLYAGTFDDAYIYAVDSPGTGAFVSDFRHGAQPIGHVVVFPSWYVFDSEIHPPVSLAAASVIDPVFDSRWYFRADPRVLLKFTGALPLGWSFDLQVRRGSSLASAPPWQPVEVPANATGWWMRLKTGQAMCVRYRVVPPAGTARAWRRPSCVTRPFDDSRARVRGRVDRVADPYFSDASASRPRRGGALVLAGIRRGSLAGFVFTSRGAHEWQDLGLGVPCLGPGYGGSSATAGWPSAAWGRARCNGPLVLANKDGYEDVSGLIVVPPWAARWNRFPFV